MKKFVIGMVGIIVVLAIAAIILNAIEPKVKESTSAEIISKFENKDSFLFVIGGSTCEACVRYKNDILPRYLKQNNELELVFIYQDLAFYNTSEWLAFKEEYGITYEASPTTYIVKDGVVITNPVELAKQGVNNGEGYMKLDQLNQFIKDNYK